MFGPISRAARFAHRLVALLEQPRRLQVRKPEPADRGDRGARRCRRVLSLPAAYCFFYLACGCRKFGFVCKPTHWDGGQCSGPNTDPFRAETLWRLVEGLQSKALIVGDE